MQYPLNWGLHSFLQSVLSQGTSSPAPVNSCIRSHHAHGGCQLLPSRGCPNAVNNEFETRIAGPLH